MIGDVTSGVVTSIATQKVSQGLEAGKQDEHLVTLQEMRDTLRALHAYLVAHSPAPESKDVYKVVTLYKVGFGPAWIPSLSEHQFIRIMAPIATAVLVTSIIGPPFVLTLPAPTLPGLYSSFDFPDQTSYTLDATATANAMNVWVRWTNDKP